MAGPPGMVPGHVFVIRTSGLTARLIRFGACCADKPNLSNHVAGFHHWTDDVPWGIEGRPGGIGWVDMRKYFGQPYLLSNVEQPIPPATSLILADAMVQAIGGKYDWTGIAADAVTDLGLDAEFAPDSAVVQGQRVCSSLYAWLYRRVGLVAPPVSNTRLVQPSDWDAFILNRAWLPVV